MAKKAKPALREVGLEDALSEAFGEFSSLAEEMRSWADGMEEKFSSTDRYARVSEAADTLENHTDAPDVAECLEDIKVSVQDLAPRKRGYSRADRCGQACYILDLCINALDEIEGEGERKDEAESLRDEIDNVKSECEGVEFPGMYG